MNQNACKRALFEAALTQGKVGVVVLDAPGLELPMGALGDGCCLEYGYNMPRPVQDLEVNDDGISAMLSFNQAMAKTFVPWDAVVEIKQAGKLKAIFAYDLTVRPSKPKAVA